MTHIPFLLETMPLLVKVVARHRHFDVLGCFKSSENIPKPPLSLRKTSEPTCCLQKTLRYMCCCPDITVCKITQIGSVIILPIKYPAFFAATNVNLLSESQFFAYRVLQSCLSELARLFFIKLPNPATGSKRHHSPR